MSWRGTEGGIVAARQKHTVVMTPGSHCYFDHYQGDRDMEPLAIGGFTPVEKVYSFEPIPYELEPQFKQYILGAQANVWTEYISTKDHVLYMVLPRMTALSEVLWNTAKTPKENRNFQEFTQRLLCHFAYYDKHQLKHSRSINQLKSELAINQNQQLQLSLSSHFPEKNIRYSINSLSKTTNTTDFQIYKQPIMIMESCQIQVFPETGKVDKKWSKIFQVNKATAKPISLRKNPSVRYNIGGPLTLNDGLVGNNPWISKEWLGWLGDTMDVTLNLEGKTTKNDSVIIYFLNAPESWIHLPHQMEISGSKDGKTFKKMSEFHDNLKINAAGIVGFKLKKGFKYFRIVAIGPNKIPVNFPGTGESPWLFCSEIQVK
jgi:hexosaminidase